MSRKSLLIIIGSIITLLPFLAFPLFWEQLAMVVGGITIILSLVLTGDRKTDDQKNLDQKKDFVENTVS